MKLNLTTQNKEPEIIPNKYGIEILRHIKETEKNLIVQAEAGSGKTTLLKMAGKQIPPSKTAILVCFNTSTAAQAQAVMPFNVTAINLHKLGMQVLRNNYTTNLQVRGKKLEQILQYKVIAADTDGKMDKEQFQFFVSDGKEILCPLITHIKENQCTLEDAKEIAKLFKLDYLPEIHKTYLKKMWPFVIKEPAGRRFNIDFSDMIWMPVFFELDFPTYDYVLIDEVQDLNLTQIEFIGRLCHE